MVLGLLAANDIPVPRVMGEKTEVHITKWDDREYATGKCTALMDVVACEECFHNWQSAID